MARRERPGRTAGKGAPPRHPKVRLKTARGRKASSARWLARQLNDPYVAEAGRRGYRSRAAWKLAEIDDRFTLLKPGARVIDLGAAPGGWTQVAVERAGAGAVLAVDALAMAPLAGARALVLDLREAADCDLLVAEAGEADVVLSDMASPATGHRATDQIRNRALVEVACEVARRTLRPGGALVVKAFHGGGAGELMQAIKRDFAEVRTFKPPASRAESGETYIVARGFRARREAAPPAAG